MVSLAPIAASALPKALEAWAAGRATPRELAVNHTVAVGALDGLWLVAAGEIDVFVAERLPDGRQGSRRHLMSAKAPAVVSGFALPEGAQRSIEIVAVSRGATVMQVLAAALADPLPDNATAMAFASLVDGWVAAMTAGLTRDFTPRTATTSTLGIGDTLTVPEGNLACAAKGVVWTLVAEGEGRFLGIEPVAAGALLPLSTESWLTETGGLTLVGYGGGGLVRGQGWWARFKTFHGLYAACLAASLAKNSQLEAWRLERRATTVAEGLDGALGKLARLVGVHERPPLPQDPDNALAVACAIACKPLGITIEAAPQMNRRRAGDDPLTVEEIARISRIRTRQMALRGTWWREDNGPMVAFAEDDGRPVALVPSSPTSYVAHDVVRGERRALTAAMANGLAPMAWTFYTPLPDGKLTVWGLFKHGLGRQTGDILAALAAGCLGGLLGLAVPVATGLVFQHVIPGHHANQLLQVGLALVMAAAVTTILKITGDVALLRIEGRMAGQLQAGVIDRLLRLPSSFFNAYSTGDLAQRTLMVEAVRRALTGLVLSSMLAGVFSLFSFALLFWYQPFAALAAGLLFVTILAVSAATGLAQLRAITEGEALAGNIMGLTLQMIAGIQKLRMAGAENRAFVMWGRIFAEMRARLVRSRSVVNAYGVFTSGWDVLSLGVVFLVMAVVAGEDLETGTFLAFVSAFTMFMGSIGQVARAVMQCFAVVPMVRRAKPLLEAIPEVDTTKADPGRLTGDIEINQAYFRYDRDSPRVLNGLTLQVRPGQFVALVGPSGCGKSTLMKLLLGFERPEAGGVFYDGRDLRTLDVQAVRRQIGVVLQSGRVMPGSIYENIKGASEATVDQAWEAAAMASLDDDIRAMPMGLHTMLTEGSAALSGGQVQRLLIARALVSKPRIVLFDEATSALDNQTQAVVTRSLSKLSVTRIAIAHRLSTVKDADRIFVLDEGKVAESGTYEELMTRNGLFAQLARRQLA